MYHYNQICINKRHLTFVLNPFFKNVDDILINWQGEFSKPDKTLINEVIFAQSAWVFGTFDT